MANRAHLQMLEKGVGAWNNWRFKNPKAIPDLSGATLNERALSGADLSKANLVHATLDDATLKNASIFGVSAWDVSKKSLKQENLIITPNWESAIAVDDIEIGQFIYLLLSNERIRDIIDTVTSKSVLILGRFSEKRKRALDSIREAVRGLGYVPIIFDFLPSPSRDLTETVQLLANMSRFVIADLTGAKSISQELSHIIPNLPSVPIQPILHGPQWEYEMFEHWRKFKSVLPEFRYENELHLMDNLQDKAIKPVQEWEKGEDEVLSLQKRIKKLEAKLAKKK